MNRCGGVVLVGGGSTRMGFPKWKLPIDGGTLLARTLRVVQSACDPCVIVTAPEQVIGEVPVDVVHDAVADRGPLQGMEAGLSYLDGSCEFAFVSSVDAPGLQPEFVRALVERSGDHDVVVPVTNRHYPLTAVYRISTILPLIRKMLAEDVRRPFMIFDQVNTLEVHEDELRESDPKLRSLLNANTPDEWRALGGEWVE